MTTLQAHLDTLNSPDQLFEISYLLNQAEAKITFWGNRVIEMRPSPLSSGELTGSVYLSDIVTKIGEIGQQFNEQKYQLSARNPEASVQSHQRNSKNGLTIIRKVKEFYKLTDKEIKNANLFTQFMNWIRAFSFSCGGPRFMLEECLPNDFSMPPRQAPSATERQETNALLGILGNSTVRRSVAERLPEQRV